MACTRNERNVVILGKMGSGKRTLGNHIVGGEKLFHQEHGHLGTRKKQHTSSFIHYGERTMEDTLYRIITVDTESLRETYNSDLLVYIRKNLQNVHLILFVVTADSRYTDESHSSLNYGVDSLNKIARSISALIITHCETKEESDRKNIIAEFEKNSRSSQVVAFTDMGTHAVGFLDTSTMVPNVKEILQWLVVQWGALSSPDSMW